MFPKKYEEYASPNLVTGQGSIIDHDGQALAIHSHHAQVKKLLHRRRARLIVTFNMDLGNFIRTGLPGDLLLYFDQLLIGLHLRH